MWCLLGLVWVATAGATKARGSTGNSPGAQPPSAEGFGAHAVAIAIASSSIVPGNWNWQILQFMLGLGSSAESRRVEFLASSRSRSRMQTMRYAWLQCCLTLPLPPLLPRYSRLAPVTTTLTTVLQRSTNNSETRSFSSAAPATKKLRPKSINLHDESLGYRNNIAICSPRPWRRLWRFQLERRPQ